MEANNQLLQDLQRDLRCLRGEAPTFLQHPLSDVCPSAILRQSIDYSKRRLLGADIFIYTGLWITALLFVMGVARLFTCL